VLAKAGRFGPYVTEQLPEDASASAKPRTASLLKSMALDTVTLDDALKLLTLPRLIGELDGEPVTVQNGRYGPYAKKGTDSRSLESEDQLFTLTLAEAKELFAQPKARAAAPGPPRRRCASSRGPSVRQADGDQGRPVRPLRDRRRDQRVAAQGRRGRLDHRPAGRGAAGGPAHRAAATRRRTTTTRKKAAPKAATPVRSGLRNPDFTDGSPIVTFEDKPIMRPVVPILLRRELPRRSWPAAKGRRRPGGARARRRRRNRVRQPGVLSIRPFRRLWIALSLSSLGDWLSILALIVLAPSLTSGGAVAKTSAVGGVWVVTLLPALLFGPLAGALADRLDRRMMMIVGDVIRGLLFLSIPLFPNLTWIYAAKFLAGIASQFWNPATAASIPNLVPKDKLERANQLSLLTTYGTAPLAAGLFSVLALVSEGISRVTPLFPHASNVDLALYFNAASYGISALTVFFIREIPKRSASGKISVPSTLKSIWEGWRFIRSTPAVRGLVIGMLGAFAAAGVVSAWVTPISTTRCTAAAPAGGWSSPGSSSGWRSAWGLAPRCSATSSRRRLFGVTLTAARCRSR